MDLETFFDATFQMLSEKGFAWRSPLTTLQIVQVALLVVRKPRKTPSVTSLIIMSFEQKMQK